MQGHLLIGPPSSGKSTLAKIMAPILNAEIISTDLIREKIYGDENIQGEWSEIKLEVQNQIINCLRNKKDFIIDATHAKRDWRLSITQNLNLSYEIEWFGWWLKTPKLKCFEWNKLRPRKVPEKIIGDYWDILNDNIFGPNTSEGFKDIREIDPSISNINKDYLDLELKKMRRSILEREKNYPAKSELHDYSALLDFERLIYLIYFLSKNLLDNISIDSAIEKSCNYLKNNFGECYSDPKKIKADLNWLNKNQFFYDGENSKIFLDNKNINTLNTGGWPYTARKQRFIQSLGLLRHIIHNPFDFSSNESSIYNHLTKKLSLTHTPREDRKIKEDCEKILRPYFLRNKNTKHKNGYYIGNSILDKSQLKDLCLYMDQASKKLGDTNAQSMHAILSERLKWGGIISDATNPIRVFANHSIVHQTYTNSYSLAKQNKSENNSELGISQLEDAILNGNRIVIERLSSSASFPGAKTGQTYPIWPLQLIFHNIGWYLAYEEEQGRLSGLGLLKVDRLDRIALKIVEKNNIRNLEERKINLQMLNELMSKSGGIYFGEDANLQKIIFSANTDKEIEKYFVKVRFSTNKKIYKFMREGLQRYPLNQIRMSKPLKNDPWKIPKGSKIFILKPDPENKYPFPIEIYLPPWTIERDIDFQRWLFGFGNDIKIESPEKLKEKYIEFGKGIQDTYK